MDQELLAKGQVLDGEAGARPAGSPERRNERKYQGSHGIWKCSIEVGQVGPGGGVRDFRGVRWKARRKRVPDCTFWREGAACLGCLKSKGLRVPRRNGDQLTAWDPPISGSRESPSSLDFARTAAPESEGLHGIAKRCSNEPRRIVPPRIDAVKDIRAFTRQTRREARSASPLPGCPQDESSERVVSDFPMSSFARA